MAYYCLVNHEKRFIVCVDPKCGCTTIKNWFNNSLSTPFAKFQPVIKQFMIKAKHVSQYDDYHRIFVVRDPLRRLVSFYYQWVVLNQKHWCFADKARQVGLQEHTFSEFIRALETLAAQGLPFQHHLKPQTRTLNDTSVDEVIKLEELGEHFRALNERLGIDYTPRHLNQTPYVEVQRPGAFDVPPSVLREEPRHPYQSFYNEELRRIAAALYAADMQFHAAH